MSNPDYRIIDHGDRQVLSSVSYDADGTALRVGRAVFEGGREDILEELELAISCARDLPILAASEVLAGIEHINGGPSRLDGGLA